MSDRYTVNGNPATVADGRIVLHLDDAEAEAFRAWLASDAAQRQQQEREDATALACGLGVEGIGGDA